MSTQSPGTGLSSCSRPRSILRRTPTTSTSAESWLSEKISTIFPGMARHIRHPPATLSFSRSRSIFAVPITASDSLSFASGNVKRQLEFIFELYSSASRSNWSNLEVAQANGDLSRSPQNIAFERDSRCNHFIVHDPAQGQLPVQ